MFIFFILLFAAMDTISGNSIFDKLDTRMKEVNSLVCVGLDPDISKIPTSVIENNISDSAALYAFLTKIIDITAPHACSYKIQKAFYDQLDDGHELLRDVVAYIHTHYPQIPAFVDCKIGDTDNTMKAYMQLMFDDIKADAVVINPYMGDDVFEPFMLDGHKTAIVLVQTSNPQAKIVQEQALTNGKKLWEEILSLTIHRWNKKNNLMVVLSSNTALQDYQHIRAQIPQDMPILLAGIGAQGGNPEIMKQLLNKEKRGVFVNSSRGILYPYTIQDVQWEEKVLSAVIDLKNTLNAIRDGSC